ncbi:MAG: hypothetical protein V1495_06975 [Pseudomonadota bacterium]
MTSWNKPTEHEVSSLLARITQPTTQSYVFERLNNPLWAEPLFAHGCFRKPPDPIRDEARGTIQFPSWPELDWLARMTKHTEVQDLVHNIALKVPETDNYRVRINLLEIALALPPHQAKDFIRFCKSWINDRHYHNIPELFSQLVVRLAIGGETTAALSLCKDLLSFRRKVKQHEFNGVSSEDSDVEPYFDGYQYTEVVRELTDKLSPTCGKPFFDLLCSLLNAALHATCRDSSADYSYIWRPAVEDHEQNQDFEKLTCTLVPAIRDVGEYLIRNGDVRIEDLVSELEIKAWPIFRRIGLHFLRTFHATSRDQALKRALDKQNFDNLDVCHEYFLLLQTTFPTFSPEEQAIYYQWVNEGPDKQKYTDVRTQWHGQAPSEEQVQQYVTAWRRDHLAPVQSCLTGPWKQQYKEFEASAGQPHHPEFPSYHGDVWVGPESPEPENTLQSLAVPDLVAYLKTWIPPTSPSIMRPSIRGLGRALQSIVSQEPVKYAAEATAFMGLNPTYIRGVIEGFTQALKSSKTFPWPRVLELSKWAVFQWNVLPGDRRDEDVGDTHWGGVRTEAARLLQVGLDKGPGEVPTELRSDVWHVLLESLKDPDPSKSWEGRHSDVVADAPSIAINSTRGETVTAIIKYALWVRRAQEDAGGAKPGIQAGFSEMPEVREAINQELTPTHESSVAVHSLFGRWFPWLALLDEVWAKENIATIFPSDDLAAPHLQAAWESYLLFCRPYKNIVALLGTQYLLAAKNLDMLVHERSRPGNSQQRFMEHLTMLYLSDDLVTAELRQAFETALSNGSPSLRSHCLHFVGRNLGGKQEDTPVQMVDRAKTLWQDRLRAATSSGIPSLFVEELSSFEWWAESPSLDFPWVLDQLQQALSLGVTIDIAHHVIARIHKDFQLAPMKALDCLHLLINQTERRWGLIGREQDLSGVLVLALGNADRAIQGKARDLINTLGKLGHLRFGELLTKDSRRQSNDKAT